MTLPAVPGIELEAAFRGILGPGFAVVAERIEQGQTGPREADFAAGRRAAAVALRRAGSAAVEVGAGEDREPLWPEGFIGSISHSGGWAVAVAARLKQFDAVGIDFEQTHELAPELAASLVAPGEMSPSLLATFVAKEAGFKAQFPLTRQFLEFTDHSLRWQGTREYETEVGQWRLLGSLATAGGFTVAACRAVPRT